MEEFSENLLESIFQETVCGGADETLDEEDYGIHEEQREDVEMLDAETLDAAAAAAASSESAGGSGVPQTEGEYGSKCAGLKGYKGRSKKKNRRRRKGGAGGDAGATSSIADMNRFVIQTCRHLKEHKSYLLWNAVGCLGVSAIDNLVKEVDVIQSFGGQKTADGSRFRTGGGILWNILKTREPKAYKEIMAKGRKFEKQFRVSNNKMTSIKEGVSMSSSVVRDEAAEVSENFECRPNVEANLESSDSKAQRKIVDRMRVLVSYEDLPEEGEIHD